MEDKISKIKQNFEKEEGKISPPELRIKYLGRHSELNGLLHELATLSDAQKKATGSSINKLKKYIETQLDSLESLSDNSQPSEDFDPTLPGNKPQVGSLHPTTKVINLINQFFIYQGYSVYEGPEIETEENNFGKLNLPSDHPARELMDTLYIKQPEYLLRTHTSSVEARALTNEALPIRIVVPGKVYRNETENTTNNSMFYQYEGLLVDHGVNMSHLKGTLIAFVKYLYGEDVKTRFRCKYYPQVEPGVGLDIECPFCLSVGCMVCKYRGFIEILGAGMVHPNMLKSCGIDHTKYSGFAFGMGLDRLVMTKYEIADIRKLYNGELVTL